MNQVKASEVATNYAFNNWSIAFHYGAKPPLGTLRAFDVVVVDPDHIVNPKPHATQSNGKSELFAYVSIGEVQPSRSYFSSMQPAMIKGENRVWESRVIDQSHPQWPEFFVERVIAPLWQNGYRGFFLDTMDSFHLIAATAEAKVLQENGLIATIKLLKQRYPEAKLIANRGFEVIAQIAPDLMAVAAESLFSKYDHSAKSYGEVPVDDRAWLKGKLNSVRDTYKLIPIAIDYVNPRDRKQTLEVARKIRNEGFVPFVTDGQLSTVGIGNVVPIARRIAVLHDGSIDGDEHVSSANRSIVMPLQYLGYRVELIDVNLKEMPKNNAAVFADQYAGVITWIADQSTALKPALTDFLLDVHQQGVKIVMFNQLPTIRKNALSGMLGFSTSTSSVKAPLRFTTNDAKIVGFEAKPSQNVLSVLPLTNTQITRPILKFSDASNASFDGVAITPWGGFASFPFAMNTAEAGTESFSQWVIDPIEFLRLSLNQADDTPIADVTTENGRRLSFVHIDGDGFPSKAELPGSPFASEVMRKEFIAKYPMPHTVSVIQGELAANGLFSSISPALEAIARNIYALPHVEAATHTLSHPFDWRKAVAGSNSKQIHLPVPGYKFNLNDEIAGSANYINNTLLPAGKKTKLLLWTGDCVPPAAAIEQAYASGLLNLNGGDTVIRKSIPTLFAVSAMSIRKNDNLQIYTAQQNENVYTSNWLGPFYGFDKVLETFEMTNKPRRLKPVNLYYHTYVATKQASIASMHRIYSYIQSNAHYPIFASDYVKKVIDFEEFGMAREIDPSSSNIKVVTAGDLRTFRLSESASKKLSFSDDRSFSTLTAAQDGYYISLKNGANHIQFTAQAALANNRSAGPNIVSANGRITQLLTKSNHSSFSLRSEVSPEFDIHHQSACSVSINGRKIDAIDTKSALEYLKFEGVIYRYKPSVAARVEHLVSVNC